MAEPKKSRREEGGYYAIKGFLYQFDRTIIEIINNPSDIVTVESKEDIGVKQSWTQVKHKETQDYSHSRIKKAVIQLLELFSSDPSLKLSLYCYFKDKQSSKWRPDTNELDAILGSSKSQFSSVTKTNFLRCFTVVFAEDFEMQFESVRSEIKKAFLVSDDSVNYYHALIRSYLLDVAKRKSAERTVSFSELKQAIKKATHSITLVGYQEVLTASAYETLMRKIFSIKTANINDFNRLFVISVDHSATVSDLVSIVKAISDKYFRTNKVRPPFVCFVGVEATKLVDAKRKLWDQELYFNDGTHFADDKFRFDSLLENSPKAPFKVKLVSTKLLSEKRFISELDEIYQFHNNEITKLAKYTNRHVLVPATDVNQVLRILR